MWSMAKLRAICRWRSIDLRFSDPKEEADFKASTEPELVRLTLSAGSIALVVLVAGNVEYYLRESGREDLPFSWSGSDPRTLAYAVVALETSITVMLIAACLIRIHRGRLRCLNWEVVATSAVVSMLCSMFPMSAWHAARTFGADPAKVWLHDTSSGEMLTVLGMIMCELAVCMYLPIRAFILWVVPLASICSYLATVIAVGSPFPQASMLVAMDLVVISLFSLTGALRQERRMRDAWLAREEVREQDVVAHALHEMTGTLCEVVVSVDADLCVFKSNAMHDAFFGQAFEGRKLASVIAEGDQEHFHELLGQASASHTLESMPVTLELPLAVCSAQLCVIRAQGRLTHFLVGFSQCEHRPRVFEEDADPQPAALLPRIAEDEVMRTSQDQEARALCDVSSVVTTSFSDAVFKDIDRLVLETHSHEETNLRKTLENIAGVGVREHWLVGSSEVSLLPEAILGKGGFGIVCVGLLRGSVVAVKLSKHRESTKETIKKLSSFCNELRILRHIRHKHIVAFHGACIEPGSGDLALIFEYVNGASLKAYVTKTLRCGQDVLARLRLLFDLSSALAYLHSLKPQVVHGDIKNSNSMVEQLGGCGRAKLLDLGLARRLTKQARPLGGTRRWAAPELYETVQKPRPSADVFSFGLLIYFVMTGQMPQGGSAISDSAWAPAIQVTARCRDLCQECLLAAPGSRPSMADVLASIAKCFLKFPPEEVIDAAAGKDIIAFLSGGLPWEEGLQKVQAVLAALERADSAQEAAGREDSPAQDDPPDTDPPRNSRHVLVEL